MCAVAIVGAIALLSLAAPTAAARDGAELTAAAASLGVAHPTGFALEMVALRVAMLVPVGDVAFRANALTALFGALALGLVARLALDAAPLARRGPSVPEDERPETASFAAVCAPIALFASRTAMRGFTAVEVYASSLALSLAALGALRWLAPSAALRALALCAGLSFVTHTSVRAAILAAALALGWSRAPVVRSLRPRAMIAWLSLAALALALVGYLIVAARREPWADWGGPDDLSGLWAHVSAARIRAAFSEQMGASGAAIDAAAAAGSALWQDLGPVTLLAALAGAMLALRDRAALSRALVLAALFDFAYTVFINPMGTRDRQTLFLTEAALCTLAARAVIASWALSSRTKTALPVALAALVSLSALSRMDLSYSGAREGWTAVEVYGGPGAIGALPPRAVVLCESDELCGGSLFARVCEGERPDSVVLPRQHLWDRTVFRRLRVALGHAPRERAAPRRADEALRARRLRAIVRTFGERVRWEQGERLDERIAEVSLSAAETPVLAATVSVEGMTEPESLRSVSRWLAARESRGALARRIAATVLFSAGMRAATRSLDAGAPFFAAALERDPTHAGALTNLGVVYAAQGRLDEAIALTERALRAEPERTVARQNLARYRAARGR